jgi:hypothetical protein
VIAESVLLTDLGRVVKQLNQINDTNFDVVAEAEAILLGADANLATV